MQLDNILYCLVLLGCCFCSAFRPHSIVIKPLSLFRTATKNYPSKSCLSNKVYMKYTEYEKYTPEINGNSRYRYRCSQAPTMRKVAIYSARYSIDNTNTSWWMQHNVNTTIFSAVDAGLKWTQRYLLALQNKLQPSTTDTHQVAPSLSPLNDSNHNTLSSSVNITTTQEPPLKWQTWLHTAWYRSNRGRQSVLEEGSSILSDNLKQMQQDNNKSIMHKNNNTIRNNSIISTNSTTTKLNTKNTDLILSILQLAYNFFKQNQSQQQYIDNENHTNITNIDKNLTISMNSLNKTHSDIVGLGNNENITIFQWVFNTFYKTQWVSSLDYIKPIRSSGNIKHLTSYQHNRTTTSINTTTIKKPIQLTTLQKYTLLYNTTSNNNVHLIDTTQSEYAIIAALEIQSEFMAIKYQQYIGVTPILALFHNNPSSLTHINRINAIKSIDRLVQYNHTIAIEFIQNNDFLNILYKMLEAPVKGLWSLQTKIEQKERMYEEFIAVKLLYRLVRSSSSVIEVLRGDTRVVKSLARISSRGGCIDDVTITDTNTSSNSGSSSGSSSSSSSSSSWARAAILELSNIQNNTMNKQNKKGENIGNKNTKLRKINNSPTVGETGNLTIAQMSTIVQLSLGYSNQQWKPRRNGQKGLRILSFDGGGTRGVLSIAYLKEILQRVNSNNIPPHEMFDIICGTSTGGILAVLLGIQRCSIDETELLYDNFIDKIFKQRSNIRLMTEKAVYDDRDWEEILYNMCSEQLLLDNTYHKHTPKVFCVSTKMNHNPPIPYLWRNYHYPTGAKPRYSGTHRVNTYTAIKATTAAPTFFKPVLFEDNIYCDGALVANNPTAIALQEAKVCR